MEKYLKRGLSVVVIFTLLFSVVPIGVDAKEINENNFDMEQEQQKTLDDKVGGLREGQIEVIKEETTSDGYLTQEVKVPLLQDGYYSLEKEAVDNISTAGLSNVMKENLKNDILEALKKAVVTLDVSKYKIPWDDNDLTWELFKEVINENPDLYYVSESAGRTGGVGNIVARMNFDYDFSRQTGAIDKLAYERAIQNILSNVKPEMTTEEKILAVHESFCEWVEYDNRLHHGNMPYESYSAYGALINGKAVCGGYSLAFVVLMQRIGVESKMVISPAMNHGWNLVKIDDNWYHIDTTWDDSTEVTGTIDHVWYLKSDKNNGHYGWDASKYPRADSEKFDEFYNLTGKMYYESGKWIYSKDDLSTRTKAIYCSKIDGTENEKLIQSTSTTGIDVYTVWDDKIYYVKWETNALFSRSIYVNNLDATDERVFQSVSQNESEAIQNLNVLNNKLYVRIFNPDIIPDVSTNYFKSRTQSCDLGTDEFCGTSVASYRTHVQNVGWQDWKIQDNLSGTLGQNLRLEGIEIKLNNENCDLGIEYCTHVENIGWQDWVSDGEMSGTKGKGYRVEAIKIRLTGKDADKFDVYYRPIVQDFGLLDWAKNGEEAGTAGYGYRLEGICISVVPKVEVVVGPTAQPFKENKV